MVNPGGKAYGHPMPNHPKHHGYHPNVPGAVGKTLYHGYHPTSGNLGHLW